MWTKVRITMGEGDEDKVEKEHKDGDNFGE